MVMPFRHPDKPRDAVVETIRTLPASLWLAQFKYDGWRMPTFIDGANTVRFLSRVGRSLASRVKLPANLSDHIIRLDLPDGTVLDTEFVGPRGSLPPTVYIFDCLAWGGKWLCSEHYSKRWQRCLNLAPMLSEDVPVRLATTVHNGAITGTDASEIKRVTAKIPDMGFLTAFESLKAEWLEAGKPSKWLYEGIVVKRLAGTLMLNLTSNKKSQHMVKLRFREIGEERY